MKTLKVVLITAFSLGVIYVSYKLLKPMFAKTDDKKKACEDAGGTWDGVECKKNGVVITPVVTTSCVAESFPLKTGMCGEKIRAMRKYLGLSDTDVFDQAVLDAIKTKFGQTVVSVTETQYNYVKNYFNK